MTIDLKDADALEEYFTQELTAMGYSEETIEILDFGLMASLDDTGREWIRGALKDTPNEDEDLRAKFEDILSLIEELRQ